jgi:formylglycine-generating enzyme required for sulfatase activity
MLGRRRTLATVAVVAPVAAAAFLGAACGFTGEGTRDLTPDSADTSPPTEAATIPRLDGGAPDGNPTTPGTCPTTHGAMVLVDKGGLVFCIDATEVTNAEYAAFLSATLGLPGSPVLDGSVPPGCSGNLTLTPSLPILTGATNPAASIDWCDAYAFCGWAGKRLCGKTASGSASTGEWFNACSNGGVQAYPYGATYAAGQCNDDTSQTIPVGSRPTCRGGVLGLYDMNGNVAELIDSCSGTTCSVMGGSYQQAGSCALAASQDKAASAPGVGFRCCADPR